jgi:two-component system, NarL family, response regulator NreC
MGRISIVLADDHPLVRQGLRTVLETEGDCVVVGEAADGLRVVDLVERIRPDVLVLDLMLPGLNGLEITRQVTQRALKTRVVIVSMHAEEGYVLEALRNGASGYVLKDANPADVVLAVREAAAGRRFLCRPLSERALAAYAQQAQAAPRDAYETLTTREREVFQLIAESASNTEVAARLGISPRTVETHRANLMRKLGLQSQTDLIRYALRRGIVPLDT